MKSAWDIKTCLTDKERDGIRRAVNKVIKSIFEREKNGTKRRLLCDFIGSQAFYDSALCAVQARHVERASKSKKRRK